MGEFSETSGTLARAAGVTVQTIVAYANAGLLEHYKISNGTRLFRSGQADKVRQIYAARIANRGKRATTDIDREAA